jgi:hypothetical protein
MSDATLLYSPSRSITRKLSNSFKIRQENTIPNRVEQEEEKLKKT